MQSVLHHSAVRRCRQRGTSAFWHCFLTPVWPDSLHGACLFVTHLERSAVSCSVSLSHNHHVSCGCVPIFFFFWVPSNCYNPLRLNSINSFISCKCSHSLSYKGMFLTSLSQQTSRRSQRSVLTLALSVVVVRRRFVETALICISPLCEPTQTYSPQTFLRLLYILGFSFISKEVAFCDIPKALVKWVPAHQASI